MGVCDAQGGMPPHSGLPLSLCVGGFTRLGDCGRFGPPLIRLITLQTYVQRAETGVRREFRLRVSESKYNTRLGRESLE